MASQKCLFFILFLQAIDNSTGFESHDGEIIINPRDYEGISFTLQPFIDVLRLYTQKWNLILGHSRKSPRILIQKKISNGSIHSTQASFSNSTKEKTLPDVPKTVRVSGSNNTFEDTGCVTNGGETPNLPCVFPFIYKGIEYTTCTWKLSIFSNNQPWCSTKVDANRNYIKGHWGNCDVDKCLNKYPPRECGMPVKRRRKKRIVELNELHIEEVPWMTSIGKYSNGKWDHKCGGSLISHRFILTSAHCLDGSIEDYRVRLGNADLNAHNWLRSAYVEKKASSKYEIKSAIKRTYIHPKFILHLSYFDIALAETEIYIPYTDYVRPICLPFNTESGDSHVNDLVIIAGWGWNKNGTTTNKLQQTRLQVYPKKSCEKMYPDTELLSFDPRKVSGNRIQLPEGVAYDLVCIGSDIQQSVACHGDSGSPSVQKVLDTTREPYYEVLYLVTTGNSCNESATIYSKVNHPQTLPWIRRIAGMEHHLVAIGGFSPNRTNLLLRDVEFISSTPNNYCQNRIGLLNGKLTQNFYHSAAARGRTGIVAKDRLFVCGGTNSVEHLKTCHMYDPRRNEWFYSESLNHSRADASAVLSPDGDFWILGGANGSNSADSTEVFEIDQNKWRRAAPLPSELRNSGISFHCSVRLNQTHVLLAGGYAAPYVFQDPFRQPRASQDGSEEKDGYAVPGISLKAAWIFDGFYWKRIQDMHGNRDRLSCSVLRDDEGNTKVIVAGGCREWCEISPAIADVEIYDLDLNEWSFGTSLPEPLHSAKMEEYLGRPTIVGGFNGTSQVDRIYSYDAKKAEWILLDKRLTLPRSSHALIKVPYEMFEHC